MDRMPHSSSAQRLQEYIQPQSQKSTPHTTPLPTYQPSAAQPPVQIGLSDPFHNRDPFLPPSQHHRRASYGHLNGNGAPTHHYSGERAWHHPQGKIQIPARLSAIYRHPVLLGSPKCVQVDLHLHSRALSSSGSALAVWIMVQTTWFRSTPDRVAPRSLP